METLIGPGIPLVLTALLTIVLAGCSDDVDERQQAAVYRPQPKATIRPARPGYGQQYQQPPGRSYQQPPGRSYQQPPGRSYQQQIPAQRPPGPQFEISDPGNPWAYRPIPRYTPPAPQTAPGQSWTESGGYRSGEQPRQSPGYRFGGYRPLDSDKSSKRERDNRYATPPRDMPVYPYYPAPNPYGGVAPYGYQNPMGWPGAAGPPVW